MLKLKEIDNVELLKALLCKSDNCLDVPLLHGTRRYALQITDDERKRFSTACRQVIAFANKYYYSNEIDWDRLSEYHRKVDIQFLSTVVSQYNRSDFQYGNIYLTTSFEMAVLFSKYDGGELGSNAYSQIKGFNAWGIEFDEETKAAAKTVSEENAKYQESEKVVLVFPGVSLTDLYTRSGRPILMDGSEEDIKETKELYEDDASFNHQFRLIKPEAYTAYVLGENKFSEAFDFFKEH